MFGKKLLCNPQAERVAGAGDPKVQGLFEGAGDFAISMRESVKAGVLDAYLTEVLAIEAEYLSGREACCNAAVAAMNRANEKLLAET